MLSILVIIAFFCIPFYHNWLTDNLLSRQLSIFRQARHLDNEGRREWKYGHSYVVYKRIVDSFSTYKISNPVLLLPPEEYLNKEHIYDLTIIEPCIFYYYTGHKAVWYDSPGVEKANCVLVPGPDHKVMLRKIVDKNDLDQLLAVYRTYKLNL